MAEVKRSTAPTPRQRTAPAPRDITNTSTGGARPTSRRALLVRQHLTAAVVALTAPATTARPAGRQRRRSRHRHGAQHELRNPSEHRHITCRSSGASRMTSSC
jgi:hypothetical protein